MYLDSENWLKCSVEYENEKYQRLIQRKTERFAHFTHSCNAKVLIL